MVRIDHFRGFDSYYAIPYGQTTAKGGRWRKGPGMALFEALEEAAGPQRIIAEDLGYLTDSVKQLLADSGFPGMKVMELGFDSRDPMSADYLPQNFVRNCVAYTGTHDNDTVLGWMDTASAGDVAVAKRYLGHVENGEYNWAMMRSLWASMADLTVVQAQDLLGLGSEARMNVPSTVGTNWRWRALPGVFDDELAGRLRAEMVASRRLAED